MDYEGYLKSNKWKKKRKAARRLFRTCMYCGSEDSLTVIHRHQRTLGRENPNTDLSVFCKACLTKLGCDHADPAKNRSTPKTQTALKIRVSEIRELKSARNIENRKPLDL